MTKEAFSRIKTHQSTLESQRIWYEDTFREICTYILPHRYNWEWEEDANTVRPTVYDSTAVEANRDLANGYQGYMINPSSPWFTIKFEDDQLNKDKKLEEWRDVASKGLYRVYARSNYYTSVGMSLLDQALGTAVMYVERDAKNVLNFLPQHLKGIYIAEDKHGRVDTLFHKMRLPKKEIVKAWGEGLSETQRNQYSEDPYSMENVWRAVMPNDAMKPDTLGAQGMPYSSITYLEEGDKPIHEGGYKYFPYLIYRPMKCTGEVYGKSSAWFALGDVLRLQNIQKDLLEMSSLVVRPPLNVPGELLQSVNLTPFGMNPYTDPNRQIFPINVGGNHPYGSEELQQLRKQVQSYFQVEAFKLLTMMADKEYTATQTAEMAGEKSAQLTTMTSSLTNYLDDTMEISLAYCIEAGEIPPPPTDARLKIDYVGPLTMDQERTFRTSGLLRGLNMIVPFLELQPQLWDLLRDDKVFKEILEASGVNSKFVRPTNEVEKIREQRAQAQQAQLQMELQKGQAQAYKDGTWKPEPGSASEGLMNERTRRAG